MTMIGSVDATLAGTCIYPAILAREGATSMPHRPMTGSHRAIYRLSGCDFGWDPRDRGWGKIRETGREAGLGLCEPVFNIPALYSGREEALHRLFDFGKTMMSGSPLLGSGTRITPRTA